MTRLHEALERAREGTGGVSLTADRNPLADVPQAWRFDAEPVIEEQTLPPPGADGKVATRTESSGEPAGELVSPDSAGAKYRFASNHNADRLIVGGEVTPLFVEQYRRLAAALHHAQMQSGARTVMVASAIEAEGKTLTAANVALTLSHSYQRRVLLIDADLRRPSQHVLFQLAGGKGLNDVLKAVHPASMKLPVQQVSPTLFVMPAGRPDSDPMSGLVSETMRQLLHEAGEQFDWVVVDTPPVALLTDANLLVAMVDVALLVVNANATPYPIVKRAIDAIGAERVLGVVLNRADEGETAPGYYGYAYAYSYSDAPRESRRGWLSFRRRHRRS